MSVNPKKKICIECGKECYWFSKKRCKYCASKSYKKPSKKRHSTKRGKERECLPEFFKKHVGLILKRSEGCLECGGRLTGHVSEVAHIAAKQRYPELMCDDDNVIYLCGMFSEKQCHKNFDNWSMAKVQEMGIFKECRNRILAFIEKGYIFGFKLLEKYKID